MGLSQFRGDSGVGLSQPRGDTGLELAQPKGDTAVRKPNSQNIHPQKVEISLV